MKKNQKRPCRILMITCFVIISLGSEIFSSSGKDFSIDEFGKIMVLESGRKKPMDTYARNKLMQFSGKQSIKGTSALSWMVKVLFEPQSTNDDYIFLINNPEIADALGIPPRTGRRYSFSDLQNSSEKMHSLTEVILEKKSSDWSSFEKELLRVKQNLQEYLSLRSLFSFIEPHQFFQISDSTLSALLGISMSRSPSYLQLLYKSTKITGKMKEIQRKGMDSLSALDQSLLDLTKRMYDWEKMIGNPQPHIIPEFSDEGEQWFSLWGFINRHHTDAMPHQLMNLMFTLRQEYLGKSQKGFDDAVKQYREFVSNAFVKNNKRINEPELELVYNRLNAFFYTKVLYGIAVMFSLLSISLLWKRAYYIGVCLIIVGLIIQTAGLLLRLLIMGHPPVSSLYETFVLTAWVLALIGIVLELLRMKSLGILISSVTGFIFLHVASRYSRDGDTLGMLIAVLDSSFWLTTHIVAISLGYAGFVAAGMIAHLYLFNVMFLKKDDTNLQLIIRAVYGLFIFGFIFTVAGTVLGGLWADQAWGRFWGWDPKENGALLIIIWGLIVLHARIAGWVKNNGLAIGAVLGVVMVMFTWIGVNLMGVGLHSYGKTSGGAGAFFTYICFEFVFLIIAGLLINRKKKMPQVVKA